MKKWLVKIIGALLGLSVLLFVYIFIVFFRLGIVSEGAKIPQYPVQKAALLVIDIQEGITGPSAPKQAKGLQQQSELFIQNTNQIIDKAQALQMPIIYIRHEYTDPVLNVLLKKFLAPGTPSTEIDKRVKVVSSNVFMKNKGDAFTNPQLDAYLQQQQVNQLVVMGLDATQCVDRTIKGALKRGYAVTAIPEAIISSTVEKKEKMIKVYADEGVKIVPVGEWVGQK